MGVICPCPSAMYMYKIVKSLNAFFSEIAETVFTRFYMGFPVERMLTICSNGSVPLDKMAAMPTYSKTLKIVFSRTKKALRLKSGIQHRGLKV